MDDVTLTTDLGEKTIKTMIDDYAVIQKKIAQLDKEKKTLAQALVDYANEKQLEKLYGNERKTSVHGRTYRSVREDCERLLRHYAKEHGLVDELLKTDTNALAKLIDAGTIDLGQVQERLTSKSSNRLGVASRR